MILEGLVTTLNANGAPHITPMGPEIGATWDLFTLRPFQTSTTYKNLKRDGEGVLHVTDNVEMLARAAVGQLEPLPALLSAQAVNGVILVDACRWYAFRVTHLDDAHERTRIACEVVDRGMQREFWGFNRAKHAVVEAAILATRLAFLPPGEIVRQYEHLAVIVDKTCGEQERRAFDFLEAYVRRELAEYFAK